MSIKLYDGYRYKGSLLELQKILKEAKVTYYQNAVLFSQSVKHHFIIQVLYLSKYFSLEEFQKMYNIKNEELSIPISFLAEDKMVNFYEKHLKLNDINIYPHSSNEFLLYPFLNHMFKKYINMDNYFERYGYWDNTDKPENTSSQEWSARRKKWVKILDKQYSTFYEAGLSFHLLDSNYFLFEKDILEDIEEKNNKEYIEECIVKLKKILKSKNDNQEDFTFDGLLYNIDHTLLSFSIQELYNQDLTKYLQK